MGADKRNVSSVKNPNVVFVVLGAVAVLILIALMAVWSYIGCHRPDHRVSSQPPSGRCSVSENQQSDVPPVKPVDTEEVPETPGNEKDPAQPVPPVVQPVDDRNTRVYIVQPGDTLSGISAATGVSVDMLAQANSIADVNLIYADSALVIPSSQ